MGIKKEIKEEITRILEENFDFILNTKDSLLKLENTLSTNELKISMYHIKVFMKNKGYIHNKTTNTWCLNPEITSSNTEGNKSKNAISKCNKLSPTKSKSNSITDDLKDFLKENSKNNTNNYSSKTTSVVEEENNKNIPPNTTETIRESSCIPEEDIIKEIWKITDNTSSNCEVILSNLLSLSKQLSENTSLLYSININNSQISNTNDDYFRIPSNQIIDIIHGDTKRYELTLVVNFVDIIKKKFFLKHPEITGLDKLKDTKILSMALWDYLTSN